MVTSNGHYQYRIKCDSILQTQVQEEVSKLVWKQAEGWIQYDPPQSHPCYQEWMKLKEKEKENELETSTD